MHTAIDESEKMKILRKKVRDTIENVTKKDGHL